MRSISFFKLPLFCSKIAKKLFDQFSHMKFLLFSILFFVGLLSSAQLALVPRKITDEFSMKVPLDLRQEPPTFQRTTSITLATFMSQDRKSDLSVSKSQLRWSEADGELLGQFYKANILNLYDHVNMIQEGIKEINGREFIVFEFSGQIVDEPNVFQKAKQRSDYTYIQYAIVEDGIVIFRFTTGSRLKNYWQEAIRKSMNSVEMKKVGKKKK